MSLLLGNPSLDTTPCDAQFILAPCLVVCQVMLLKQWLVSFLLENTK